MSARSRSIGDDWKYAVPVPTAVKSLAIEEERGARSYANQPISSDGIEAVVRGLRSTESA